ncbi:hypothetical protein AAHZ94_00250 [Streptomyces sp. HSW2009]
MPAPTSMTAGAGRGAYEAINATHARNDASGISLPCSYAPASRSLS